MTGECRMIEYEDFIIIICRRDESTSHQEPEYRYTYNPPYEVRPTLQGHLPEVDLARYIAQASQSDSDKTVVDYRVIEVLEQAYREKPCNEGLKRCTDKGLVYKLEYGDRLVYGFPPQTWRELNRDGRLKRAVEDMGGRVSYMHYRGHKYYKVEVPKP